MERDAWTVDVCANPLSRNSGTLSNQFKRKHAHQSGHENDGRLASTGCRTGRFNGGGIMTEESMAHGDDSILATVGKLAVLIAVLFVWAVITVGIAFEKADATEHYMYLSLLVLLLFRRVWGVPKLRYHRE